MREIVKGEAPPELAAFKRRNPNARYTDLTSVERQAINALCRSEQYSICAYCCKAIDEKNSMNEHVEARAIAPGRSLDYTNIVASCKSPRQCDDAHKAQPLLLTPLMSECETELKFYLSGKVDGLTERARECIRVLNIGEGNRGLKEQRKQLVDALIFQQSERADDLQVMDDELLEIILEDIDQPVDGRLAPFAPVLSNIIRGFLTA